jgi:DUF971 family protein
MQKIIALKSLVKTASGQIEFVWQNDSYTVVEPRELRLACPCAHCVEEFTGRPLLNPNQVSETIIPLVIKNVGRYAVNFEWSDGHKTGIFSFDYIQQRFGVLGVSENS